MIVHFKGTRGSLPIAHTSQDSTEKVVGALLEARGHDLRSESQVREFVRDHLPFHTGSTFEVTLHAFMWRQDQKNGLFLMRAQEFGLWDRKLLKISLGFRFSHFLFTFSLRPHTGPSFFTPAYSR